LQKLTADFFCPLELEPYRGAGRRLAGFRGGTRVLVVGRRLLVLGNLTELQTPESREHRAGKRWRPRLLPVSLARGTHVASRSCGGERSRVARRTPGGRRCRGSLRVNGAWRVA
jgi:hypothetical protein